MAYVLTTSARNDLDEILAWIETQALNPQGAQVVETYLFEAFERIGQNPATCGGHPRPDLTNRPVKFLTARKYVVVYDDRSEPVTIVAIAGARQDLARLMSSDPRYANLLDD